MKTNILKRRTLTIPIALLLAFIMLFTFTACNRNNTDGENAPGTATTDAGTVPSPATTDSPAPTSEPNNNDEDGGGDLLPNDGDLTPQPIDGVPEEYMDVLNRAALAWFDSKSGKIFENGGFTADFITRYVYYYINYTLAGNDQRVSFENIGEDGGIVISGEDFLSIVQECFADESAYEKIIMDGTYGFLYTYGIDGYEWILYYPSDIGDVSWEFIPQTFDSSYNTVTTEGYIAVTTYDDVSETTYTCVSFILENDINTGTIELSGFDPEPYSSQSDPDDSIAFARTKGVWRRGGEIDAAWFEMDGRGNFWAYYASGALEYAGYLEYVDEYGDGSGRYDIYDSTGEWLMGFYFDSETQFHIGNDSGEEYMREDA